MSKLQYLDVGCIYVAEDRQRQEFQQQGLIDLMQSLRETHGQLQPIVVKPEEGLLNGYTHVLIAGERRLRAVKQLYESQNLAVFGSGTPESYINFNGTPLPFGKIACIASDAYTDLVTMLEAEFAENEQRQGFTFVERAAAIHKIASLKKKLEEERRSVENDVPKEKLRPSFAGLAGGILNKQVVRETAAATSPNKFATPASIQTTACAIKTIEMLNSDKTPEAVKKQLNAATSQKEALKIISAAEKAATRHKLGMEVANSKKKAHRILRGDCLKLLADEADFTYDILLCDPPYGMGADKFGDAAGKMAWQVHKYDDSYETWKQLIPAMLQAVNRKLKYDAHLFLFCDFERFPELKQMVANSGDTDNPWHFHRVPMIQYKKEGGRLPVPGKSARRSYECFLFGWRGDRVVHGDLKDVVDTVSDRTEDNGAGKPVALLETLLRWCSLPGEKVIDPMAGSGSLLPAAHRCLVDATLMELNPVDFGRIRERLEELD